MIKPANFEPSDSLNTCSICLNLQLSEIMEVGNCLVSHSRLPGSAFRYYSFCYSGSSVKADSIVSALDFVDYFGFDQISFQCCC